MVVVFNTGVVNVDPFPIKVPPVSASYHSITPALAVAPRVTDPASHREAGVVVVILGVVFIVATTGVRAEVQLVVEAST